MKQSIHTKRLIWRPALVFLLLLGLWGVYNLTSTYLENNFFRKGEAYMKGPGHLLRENLLKGLVFLVFRHILTAILYSGLFFLLISAQDKFRAYKVISFLSMVFLGLVAVYLSLQAYQIFIGITDRKDRLLEIGVTWICWITGFHLGYYLIKILPERKHVG